jgi:dihydropyrimidinase
MTFDTIIRGGTLITPAGPAAADLGIVGEKIAAIGLGLAGTQTIDAAGKLVLPGAIDPHVHLEMPVGQTRSSDDWETGTIAAACGGTTTVIDFVEPELVPSPLLSLSSAPLPPCSPAPLLTALATRRCQAEGRAAVDFGLHMTLRQADPAILAEIPAVVAAGCPSFKTYLTYKSLKLADDPFLVALEAVAAAGGLVTVHAENDAGIAYLQRKLLAAGHTGPRYHPHSRPASMEAEAIERALALAEAVGCPLYVVHVSTGRGAEAVARARARGQAVYGETCPHYLLLTEAEYERPGFEGAKFVCSPPLRTAADNAALWRHLAAGDLQTVGTDHCPFFFKGDKELGRHAFTAIPGGMPGIEARLALLYTCGVNEGRLSPERWVEACCTAPARIFGLYPRKGALLPGADADVVLFDPAREITLTRAMLHENCDYTPYEGFRLAGYPVLTMLRGQVIVRDGQFIGTVGGGKFLPRGATS